MVGDTSGGTFVPQANDQTGVDPLLLALADNGGPTQTNALRADSPAINTGNTALTVDQRGVARPQSSADDIGAYERQFTVNCSGTGWSVGSQAELDEAILCYNAKVAAGTYTITLNQNIALGSSTITINNATAGVNLVVAGANFTVDGQGLAGVRPFTIATGTVVVMNNITIRGGRPPLSNLAQGGGISNLGQLTINDSTITDNVSGGGGGISNGDNSHVSATLTVNNSTISNNTGVNSASPTYSGRGGGILNWPGSQATINNSTISGNTASEGGGIFNGDDSHLSATLTVNNSTISGNTVPATGGAILAFGGTVTIDSSTITDNKTNPLRPGDYGIEATWNAGITLRNSISNQSCSTSNGASITSNGYNISSDATCNFIQGTDQQNVSAAALNLGPLANNGGPTQTHALLPGSVAIDTGDTTLTQDQRGNSRPSGAADDVGAYEVVTTTLTIVKNTQGGDGSFAFTSTIPSATSFTLATAGNTAQRAFPNLAPGTYSVSEIVPAGWDLTSATCSDGSNPASIVLAAGENVTCTFANARQGTIIVVKRALGEDRAFSFVSSSLGNFDLTTVNGEVQRTFSNLSPGIHDVSETVPSGWELSGGSPTCSDGSPASSINLSAGETVLCVFINLQDDTIVVEVRTTGGDGSFPFASGTLAPPSFTLITASGTAQRAFANLPPGTYDVNATVPAGWNLSSATCDNGDPPDRISMAPNQTVRCTFVYQITIAADIPTLSEWGLLLLGALLAFNLWWRGPMGAGRR